MRLVTAREQEELRAPWREAIRQEDLDDYRWERERQEIELEGLTGGYDADKADYFARGGTPLITFRDWITGRPGGAAERDAWEHDPLNDGEYVLDEEEPVDDEPPWADVAPNWEPPSRTAAREDYAGIHRAPAGTHAGMLPRGQGCCHRQN